MLPLLNGKRFKFDPIMSYCLKTTRHPFQKGTKVSFHQYNSTNNYLIAEVPETHWGKIGKTVANPQQQRLRKNTQGRLKLRPWLFKAGGRLWSQPRKPISPSRRIQAWIRVTVQSALTYLRHIQTLVHSPPTTLGEKARLKKRSHVERLRAPKPDLFDFCCHPFIVEWSAGAN